MFQVLTTVKQITVSQGQVCDKSNTTQFTPLKIWKRHAVLLCIHIKSSKMKISEWLGVNLRQIECVEIWYFSYKMKKSKFLSDHEGQEERPRCKAFEQTQGSPLTKHTSVFLRWEKFMPGSDSEYNNRWLGFMAYQSL